MKPTMNLAPSLATGEVMKKVKQAIVNKPVEPEPLLNSTANINVSYVSFEDSLAKVLLPTNYAPVRGHNGLQEIQRSYLYLADQKLGETNGDAEKLESITNDLIFNSRQAHTKVRNMFTQLGRLTQETDHLLVKSERYLFNEVADLRNTHAEDYLEYKSELSPLIEFEATTLEGDKVTFSFNYTHGFATGVMSNGVELEMQVDGDISDEESEALAVLYNEAAKYIEQSLVSDRQNFAVTTFDLDSGFDTRVLSAFEVSVDRPGMSTSFAYEIDKENDQQRLKNEMSLAGGVLNYSLDITTALSGRGEGKEQVLASLMETLEQMDSGRYMDTQVNQFLAETFDSILSKTSESQQDLDLTVLNQAINTMSSKLEGHKLTELSELADYQFSLTLSQQGPSASHESRIKMEQDTEQKIDSLGTSVSQTKRLDVTMHMMRASINTLKGHEVNWRLDQEQKIDVSVNRENELKNHKISGHHREDLEQKQFIDNILKHTFAQQVDRHFSQELEVFEETAKLTTDEKDKHKAGLFSRMGDKAKETLAESRYIREYRQVLNFEKDK